MPGSRSSRAPSSFSALDPSRAPDPEARSRNRTDGGRAQGASDRREPSVLPIPSRETVDSMSKEQLKAELVARGIAVHTLRLKGDFKQKLREVLSSTDDTHTSSRLTCALCGKTEVGARFESGSEYRCVTCRNTTLESKAEKRKRMESAVAVEKGLRDLLRCPQCKEVMCPPIWQCKSGHTVGSCCSQEICFQCGQHTLEPIRNLALEQLADKISGLPCPFAKWGCDAVVAFTSLSKHQSVCKHRPVCCPEETYRTDVPRAVRGRICKWLGKESEVVAHLKTQHGRHFQALEAAEQKEGKGRGEEGGEWRAETRLWPESMMQYFEVAGGPDCFKLETRWKGSLNRKPGACKVFVCVTYLGPARTNHWFAEITVGARQHGEGGLQWGRRHAWRGRVHDMSQPGKELEERGEGVYVSGLEWRGLRLSSALSPAGPSEALPLEVRLFRDEKRAGQDQFRQPLPEPHREAAGGANAWTSSFNMLSQYLAPSTSQERFRELMQATDLSSDDSDEEDYEMRRRDDNEDDDDDDEESGDGDGDESGDSSDNESDSYEEIDADDVGGADDDDDEDDDDDGDDSSDNEISSYEDL